MKGTTMAEETTTDVPVETGGSQQINGIPVDTNGQAIPEPEEAEPTAAVEKPTEEPEAEEEQQVESPAPEPSEDDTSEWLKKKGIDPSDPEAITKLAKSAREAERAMHQKAQRASELEKSLTTTSDEVAEQIATDTGQDPELLKRLQRVEVKEAVRDFWTENPDARAYEADMIEILQAKPHLAGDLDSLYSVAIRKSGNLDTAKSQGKREALESLAHKQQAAVPRGNAVDGSNMSSATITPENVDELVAKNDQAWFEKNHAAINKAMAG